jgi:hypothetical protein
LLKSNSTAPWKGVPYSKYGRKPRNECWRHSRRSHKNEVGGYAYNDANTLVSEIKRVLAEQLFEDSTDGMKGLLSTATNTLTEYKATISIKRKDILKDSKDAAARLSSSSGTMVQPEIATNSNAQEEADRQNTFRLAAIGVKEGVAAGITKIIGKDITNPILHTTDGISFKSVDEYQLHQLVTAITEGAERHEASTITQQFINIAGMVFDWRDTVAINVKKICMPSRCTPTSTSTTASNKYQLS